MTIRSAFAGQRRLQPAMQRVHWWHNESSVSDPILATVIVAVLFSKQCMTINHSCILALSAQSEHFDARAIIALSYSRRLLRNREEMWGDFANRLYSAKDQRWLGMTGGYGTLREQARFFHVRALRPMPLLYHRDEDRNSLVILFLSSNTLCLFFFFRKVTWRKRYFEETSIQLYRHTITHVDLRVQSTT